jgi:hypothetical protein
VFRSDGGAVLGSRGEVLVSDSSYAHHLMTPRALRDAKFSPGLGQQESEGSTGSQMFGGGSGASARRAANNMLSPSRRPRYDGPAERQWGTMNGSTSVSSQKPELFRKTSLLDDDDEWNEQQRAAARRRGGMPGGLSAAEEALANALAAQQAAAAAAAALIKPFDPRAVKANAAPTVPRAADAALHQPGGGDIGRIFSQKLDWTSVQPRVQIAPANGGAATDRSSNASNNLGSHSSRSDVFSSLPAGGAGGRRRYDHVQAKVPTAAEASQYKPGGGNVSIAKAGPMPWKATEASPTVPTAAAAALHRPRASNVSIFTSKVDFSAAAAPRAVPAGALAKDAAHYKPRGGGVDVFLWKRDPAARREPPPKKTEAQVLEELFPGSQDPTTLGDEAPSTTKPNHMQHQPRRRRGELAM